MSTVRKNKTNKVFIYDSTSTKDGLYKVYVTYLGNVTTSGKEMKVVIKKIVWGPNQHNSGAIYFFDNMNLYVGKYNLGSGFDLPEKIRNNQLIFKNTYKKDCNSNLITSIDLSKELPKQIFLKCKGDNGDVYLFSTEKD